MTVGTGIGGGLVIDGKMVHGLVHPEMGHMLLAPQEGDSMPDGVCPYHRHCLEGLASGPAIEKRWGMPGSQLPQSHPAWELESSYIAQLCVNAIMMVSPERIILGGGVMQQEFLIGDVRRKTIERLGGYLDCEAVQNGFEEYIVTPGLGVNSGVMGAYLLAREAEDGWLKRS